MFVCSPNHISCTVEAENLAFMGTTVVNGRGVGVVIRRGDKPILGKLFAHFLLHPSELLPVSLSIRSLLWQWKRRIWRSWARPLSMAKAVGVVIRRGDKSFLGSCILIFCCTLY